jgi:hypothetical protein
MKALKKIFLAAGFILFASTMTTAQTKTTKGTCTTKYKVSSYSPTRTKVKTTTKKGCDNQRKTYNHSYQSRTTYKPNTGATKPKKSK